MTNYVNFKSLILPIQKLLKNFHIKEILTFEIIVFSVVIKERLRKSMVVHIWIMLTILSIEKLRQPED